MTPFDELWIDFLLIVLVLCWTTAQAACMALIAMPPTIMTWLIAKYLGWQQAALFLAMFLFAASRVHALAP